MFNIGDTVELIIDHPDNHKELVAGDIGVIGAFDPNGDDEYKDEEWLDIGVKWKSKDGNIFWWVNHSWIKLFGDDDITPEPLNIELLF